MTRMAIPLGQPVEDITRGVEGMKIGGNMRMSETAEKPQVQKAATDSSPDAATVQVHQLGLEHHGSEKVPLTHTLEVNATEAGNFVPVNDGRMYIDNSAVEQLANQAYEPLVYSCEPYPYIGMAPVTLQSPIQTGYPAPYMDPLNYYPYYVGGDIYNSPVTSVYNQNYFYPISGADPYTSGYSTQFGYPQYQVAPVEQYTVTPGSLPLNESGAVVPELTFSSGMESVPNGYQQPVIPGQWLPMPMYPPSLMDEGMPNSDFVFIPLPRYPQSHGPEGKEQPPACVSQPDGWKGTYGGEEDGSTPPTEHPIVKNGGYVKDSMENVKGIDDKILTVENKKLGKKNPSLFYGPPMPLKGSWVRSGYLHCLSSGDALKPFNGKVKSSGSWGLNSELQAKSEMNSEDFSLNFEDGKHFVIKSFSEENVVKSIQYGVWASTANGNKKLDEAFNDAQVRRVGKTNGCPVFLYFSVNGSGKFCGVAEMVGAVDYNNSMDFWERNRWGGSFPVKWHFVKDVPHSQLRRIILHNNDNKPVTSSRDTQEVNFEQGMQMLSIIKSYSTKSSILDTPVYLQRIPSIGAMVEKLPRLEMRDERAGAGVKAMMMQSGDPQPPQTSVAGESVSISLDSSSEAKAQEGELQGNEPANGGGKCEKENV